MMLGFGSPEQRRDKDAVIVAAEAFAQGASTFEFDHEKAAPNPDLFDRATSSASSDVPRRAPSKGSSSRRASFSM